MRTRETDGREEPFAVIRLVTDEAWNIRTIGGHLLEGSILRGAFQVFIQEVDGIDLLYGRPDPSGFPEEWYREVEP